MYTVRHDKSKYRRLTVRHTWACLTCPEIMAHWMADTSRFEPGERFRLDFGDGDFFVGEVLDWQAPIELRLCWKFMGLGPRYDVTLMLSPVAGGCTEVTVLDHGSSTLEELAALREGWTDFLSRLVRYVCTGESTRYLWSEEIGLGAMLGDLDQRRPVELGDKDWWKSSFPGVDVRPVEADEDSLVLRFRDAGWQGIETEAEVVAEPLPSGLYVGVTHSGWPHLPAERQVQERRRYAGLWLAALRGLEEQYG